MIRPEGQGCVASGFRLLLPRLGRLAGCRVGLNPAAHASLRTESELEVTSEVLVWGVWTGEGLVTCQEVKSSGDSPLCAGSSWSGH